MISRLVLNFALAAFSLSSFAAPKSINDLLDLPTRPTMAQVEPVLNHISEQNGIPVDATWAVAVGMDRRTDPEHWISVLLENGPRLIAAFERTYPGARWVFLGRDGLPWADLFESFYSSIGQTDRVVRLGVSKPSFVNVTDSTLVKLMESQGIHIDQLDKEYPVVFVDSVSGGYGRQGRRLMGTIYDAWMKSRRDPLLLVNKVDMIGLQVSTFQGSPNPYQLKPLHQFLQSLFLMSLPVSGQNGDLIGNNLRILTFPEQANAANEAGYTHFMGTWHDSFGAIGYNRSEGTWEATPGPLMQIPMRQTVLWVQKKIWEFVKSGACKAAVDEEARLLGYQFPVKRPEKNQANAEQVEKFRQYVSEINVLRPMTDRHMAHALHWLTSRPITVETRQEFLNLLDSQWHMIDEGVFKDHAESKTALRAIQKLMFALQSKTCVDVMENK